MRRDTNFQQQFQDMKVDAQQAYELSRVASSAGKKLTLTGAVGADGNYHIQDQTSFLRMVAFVRMMERNDPVVASAARRLMHNVNVGQMTLGPDTGATTLNEHLKGKFDEWADDPDLCDVTGRMDFETMADIAYIRTIFDGDVLTVPREDDGALQNLESHRCQTPGRSKLDRGVCGVRTDESGTVVSYFLTRKSTGYGHVVRVSDVEEIPARNKDRWRNVFHVFQPGRFSLNRGVTSLAPVGAAASRRDDLEFATVLTAQIKSCITFIEEIPDLQVLQQLLGQGMSVGESVQTSFRDKDDAGFEMRTAQIHPGRVLEARPGRTLKMQNPSVTSEGQLALNDLLIEYMGMVLDLPSIVLRLDARHANFSQYRNVLDQARMTYGKHQRWFSKMYHRRVYRNLLRIWAPGDKMIRDFIAKEKPNSLRRSRLLKHQWHPVGWKYCQPVDDATGDLILLSSSMLSIDQYARQRYGMSGEDLMRQVVAGNELRVRLAIEASDRIKKATGRDIDWMHFAPPATRAGINIQMSREPEGVSVGGGNDPA